MELIVFTQAITTFTLRPIFNNISPDAEQYGKPLGTCSLSGCCHVRLHSPAGKQCAGAPSHFGAYCGAFRATPCASSWVPPLVAPSWTSPVTEPSGYRFASRAPVVRRPPTISPKTSAIKRARSGTAHRQNLSNPSANRRPGASSSRRLSTGTVHEQAGSGDQYDEFLASFQRRIDGMTGQSGGWGF